MTERAMPGFFNRSVLTRTLRGLRRPLALAACLSAAVNLLLLTPTLYMLQVYDRVLASQSELTLLAVSVLALASLLAQAGAEWLRGRTLAQAGLAMDLALGPLVFEAGMRRRAGLANASDTQADHAFVDVMQLRQFLTGAGILALLDAPWAPLYLAVMFLLHPLLGALGLVFLGAQVLLAALGHHRTVVPTRTAAEAGAQASRFLEGKLRNAGVIESMGMLGGLRSRWLHLQGQAGARSAAVQDQTHRVQAWSRGLRYAQQSLALAAGALLVVRGELSPGAMIATTLLMTRALAPVDQFVSGWRSFVGARQAFARLEALLEPTGASEGAAADIPQRFAVTLDQASVTLPGGTLPLLHPLDLNLPAGTVLAVRGPSGSGKSTLARLLVGLWPAATGVVRLGDRPIAEWEPAARGERIGYLPQDVDLLDGSIADNIARHGTVDAEHVLQAARSAGLHDLILRMPKGYDTPVGDGGDALSGGLRQRVGLARALYGSPALVVLDEPDANLDELGELALRQAVTALKTQGCTVVLISHHPALLALADQRLQLDAGRVVSVEAT